MFFTIKTLKRHYVCTCQVAWLSSVSVFWSKCTVTNMWFSCLVQYYTILISTAVNVVLRMCEMIAKCSYFWIMSKYGTQGAYWSWQMWVVGQLGLAGKSITSSWLEKTICIRTRQTDRHVAFWDSNQYSTLCVPPLPVPHWITIYCLFKAEFW